jgi:Zn-dependent membrane protease YugP
MAPMVNTAARFGIPAAIIGVFTGVPLLTQLGAIAYVVALAFQFLTLPIEFDASKRALAQLDQLKFLNAEEKEGARSMLRAAAMTCVAGAASSAAYVLYLVLLVGRWAFKIPARVPPPRLP